MPHVRRLHIRHQHAFIVAWELLRSLPQPLFTCCFIIMMRCPYMPCHYTCHTETGTEEGSGRRLGPWEGEGREGKGGSLKLSVAPVQVQVEAVLKDIHRDPTQHRKPVSWGPGEATASWGLHPEQCVQATPPCVQCCCHLGMTHRQAKGEVWGMRRVCVWRAKSTNVSPLSCSPVLLLPVPVLGFFITQMCRQQSAKWRLQCSSHLPECKMRSGSSLLFPSTAHAFRGHGRGKGNGG